MASAPSCHLTRFSPLLSLHHHSGLFSSPETLQEETGVFVDFLLHFVLRLSNVFSSDAAPSLNSIDVHNASQPRFKLEQLEEMENSSPVSVDKFQGLPLSSYSLLLFSPSCHDISGCSNQTPDPLLECELGHPHDD